MKVKAIIFDKDGTLIDFDAFWVSLSRAALGEVLAKCNQPAEMLEEMLTAFGVHDGVTDVNGVLCKGTYEEMARIVYDILVHHGETAAFEEIYPMVIDAYNSNFVNGEVKANCADIRGCLEELKSRGMKLYIVTTDNRVLTILCLEKLGIKDLFDNIYADDGRFSPKPCPDTALDLMAKTGYTKDDIVMIGDTMTDVRFARNAGIRVVGMAKSKQNEEILKDQADVLIRDIADLLHIVE